MLGIIEKFVFSKQRVSSRFALNIQSNQLNLSLKSRNCRLTKKFQVRILTSVLEFLAPSMRSYEMLACCSRSPAALEIETTAGLTRSELALSEIFNAKSDRREVSAHHSL